MKLNSESKLLSAAAHNNLGNAYLQEIEVEMAVECHAKACELNPHYANAHSNLLRDYTHLPPTNRQELLALHRKWWTMHTATVKPLTHTNSPDPDRKLRIGFISPDLREHSVTHFLLPIFENIDPAHFELVCYSGVMRPDEFTQMLAKRSILWRNSLSAQDDALAKMIQDDKVDILFDLSGHTSDHRLRVFAFKPAPVQVTYLGYPMTTGGDCIDYRITDPISDPPGMTDSDYAEKLFRLPHTTWCYRPPVNIPCEEVAPSVRNPTLPFTFGSFNNCSKISDMNFRMWAGVLKAVPNSRILLKASAMADNNTRKRIHANFEKYGVPADRVVLVPQQLDLASHFAYYGNIDLGLDTYTYNGTTDASLRRGDVDECSGPDARGRHAHLPRRGVPAHQRRA